MGKSMSLVPPRLDRIDLWGGKVCLLVCRQAGVGIVWCVAKLVKDQFSDFFLLVWAGRLVCYRSSMFAPILLWISILCWVFRFIYYAASASGCRLVGCCLGEDTGHRWWYVGNHKEKWIWNWENELWMYRECECFKSVFSNCTFKQNVC